MINKISIKNFKSLAETSVELGPFTVLVGANGSGKSSFLQAIELFSWAVRFPSLPNAREENQIEFHDLVHLRSPQAWIECELGLTVQVPVTGDEWTTATLSGAYTSARAILAIIPIPIKRGQNRWSRQFE